LHGPLALSFFFLFFFLLHKENQAHQKQNEKQEKQTTSSLAAAFSASRFESRRVEPYEYSMQPLWGRQIDSLSQCT
jgi:hypothetical protein